MRVCGVTSMPRAFSNRLQRSDAVTVRADRANAGNDAGDILQAPAAHESFEQSDAFENVELDFADLVPFDDDGDAPMPFDPCEVINAESCVSCQSLPVLVRSSTGAANVLSLRLMSAAFEFFSLPRIFSSDTMLASSTGPRQPMHATLYPGQRAPQPAVVTGPAQGRPRVTSRQSFSFILHSRQTG